jgi:hypothetical protein
VHVPILTNTTRPDVASIVHTSVVELEYDLAPPPVVTVDVIVGGVAVNE